MLAEAVHLGWPFFCFSRRLNLFCGMACQFDASAWLMRPCALSLCWILLMIQMLRFKQLPGQFWNQFRGFDILLEPADARLYITLGSN
jgi:hypothetical protein